MKTTSIPKNVDEYIADFPLPVQNKLEELRTTIKSCSAMLKRKSAIRCLLLT